MCADTNVAVATHCVMGTHLLSVQQKGDAITTVMALLPIVANVHRRVLTLLYTHTPECCLNKSALLMFTKAGLQLMHGMTLNTPTGSYKLALLLYMFISKISWGMNRRHRMTQSMDADVHGLATNCSCVVTRASVGIGGGGLPRRRHLQAQVPCS